MAKQNGLSTQGEIDALDAPGVSRVGEHPATGCIGADRGLLAIRSLLGGSMRQPMYAAARGRGRQA
jgi:hypothetical protein